MSILVTKEHLDANPLCPVCVVLVTFKVNFYKGDKNLKFEVKALLEVKHGFDSVLCY